MLPYQNIMKYLLSEAREKKQTAFQKGWKITIIKVTLTAVLMLCSPCVLKAFILPGTVDVSPSYCQVDYNIQKTQQYNINNN